MLRLITNHSSKTAAAVLGTAAALFVAVCFFFYPAYQVARWTQDPGIHSSGQPSDFADTFQTTAQRYQRWADDYVESNRGATVATGDVPGTEWPVFGTVFFLLSAEELVKTGQLEVDNDLRAALKRAADVLVHPASATWVKDMWGDDYLESENVFYRMLVILGLNSYAQLTGDRNHQALQLEQAQSLHDELNQAKYPLKDDYPGACYPNDVLWAVVAIQRTLGQRETQELSADLMALLDGPAKSAPGVPAFKVSSRTAEQEAEGRGSGNSGILCFAGELDSQIAQRWYQAYAENYWVDGFVKGFRETPHGQPSIFDVDSGPVVMGMGSVASAFGIGAARANGRYDHAAQLSLQVLAASWPTPWGPLIPGFLGSIAADGWCFGELALAFSLTRPNYAQTTTPHDGSVPGLVWLLLALYIAIGSAIVVREPVYWQKRLKSSAPPTADLG